MTPTRSIAAGADQDQIPGRAGRNAKSRDDGETLSACFESDHHDATASPPGGTVFVASDPGWRKNSAWSGTRLRTVNGPPVTPQRRAIVTHPRATRVFLLPQLARTARNFDAILDLVRARTPLG